MEDVSGAAFYTACTDLKNALDNQTLVHKGQDKWISQMEACAIKQNDSSWRIIKRSSGGDISGAIATAMVVTKLLKPQQVASIYVAS
jgi:hypothetical protein